MDTFDAEEYLTVVALFKTAEQFNLSVEVMATYTNSLLSMDPPNWTPIDHMMYALCEWDI